MTDLKHDTGQRSQDDPWQQVCAVLGMETVNRMSTQNRNDLQMLVEHAFTFGRSVHGPVREIQTLVGDRWSALLLMLLRHGPIRFSTLQRITGVVDNVGISRRMLSFTLRTLERNGLVMRQVLATVPPNVEYSLTKLGQELSIRILDFLEWLTTQHNAIEQARAEFDQKHGHPVAHGAETQSHHDE
jgi:DNA-binding HxlR family transcriptional regulator